MKKLKKMWVENRIIMVLAAIVLVCVIVMLVVMMRYFVGTGKSAYGDRLVEVEKLPLKDDIKNEYTSKVKENEKVVGATINANGTVIYVTLTLENATIDEGKQIMENSFQYLSEEFFQTYDFNVTIKKNATEADAGYTIMGSKNKNGTGTIWMNNTPIGD